MSRTMRPRLSDVERTILRHALQTYVLHMKLLYGQAEALRIKCIVAHNEFIHYQDYNTWKPYKELLPKLTAMLNEHYEAKADSAEKMLHRFEAVERQCRVRCHRKVVVSDLLFRLQSNRAYGDIEQETGV